MFSSIRAKFLAILLPLFLVSFIVLSGISYHVSNGALVDDADTIARRTGGMAGEYLDKVMTEKSIRLEELADHPAMRGGDRAAIIAALAAMKGRTQGFDMVAYADLSGKAVSDKGVDMDRGSRDYFKNVVSTGKPFMTGPSVSGTTGKLITIMAYPVKTNGQVSGVIYGTVSLAELSELVGSFDYMETGYVYVVDEGGICIGYKQLPEAVGKLDLTKNDQGLDQRLLDGFKAALTAKDPISSYYKTRKGVENKAVFTPIELEGRRWVAIACAPVAEVEAASSMLLKVMVGISVAIILLAAVIIVIVAKKLSDPIRELRDECAVINSGDLRQDKVTIDLNDELGDLARGFDQMRKTMRGLLNNIKGQSERVASASEELTASAHQSAEAANQVAISITEIAAGVSEQSTEAASADKVVAGIAERADGIARKSDEIAEVSHGAVEKVGEGRASIRDVVGHMNKINETTQTIQNSIQLLAKGSEEIQSIVEMISSIAGQTNLLALNAALEAARAGEHGRGFAVVADEVRKLAEQSEQSSRKIADLVTRNRADMEQAVTAGEEGSASVANGMQAVESADAVFEAISGSIAELSEGVGAVSDSIRGMANESQAMRASMDSIKNISTKNSDEAQTVSAATEEQSASMQEVAAASRELASLATDLQNAVGKFK
ncbi:MAG: methyl-accepting chemotaxis protein, partial [Schwartzia sp.]|nr:methyl-accepting chemotaxis protein [Schwartzia sp. (in: firmicutes)]